MNLAPLVYVLKVYSLKAFFSFDKAYLDILSIKPFVKQLKKAFLKTIKMYFKYTLTCLTYNHFLAFKSILKVYFFCIPQPKLDSKSIL